MNEKNLVIHPKRQKGDDGYKVFSIRVKEEIVDNINDISAKTGYSRNELIGKFLEYAVENCIVADKWLKSLNFKLFFCFVNLLPLLYPPIFI